MNYIFKKKVINELFSKYDFIKTLIQENDKNSDNDDEDSKNEFSSINKNKKKCVKIIERLKFIFDQFRNNYDRSVNNLAVSIDKFLSKRKLDIRADLKVVHNKIKENDSLNSQRNKEIKDTLEELKYKIQGYSAKKEKEKDKLNDEIKIKGRKINFDDEENNYILENKFDKNDEKGKKDGKNKIIQIFEEDKEIDKNIINEEKQNKKEEKITGKKRVRGKKKINVKKSEKVTKIKNLKKSKKDELVEIKGSEEEEENEEDEEKEENEEIENEEEEEEEEESEEEEEKNEEEEESEEEENEELENEEEENEEKENEEEENKEKEENVKNVKKIVLHGKKNKRSNIYKKKDKKKNNIVKKYEKRKRKLPFEYEKEYKKGRRTPRKNTRSPINKENSSNKNKKADIKETVILSSSRKKSLKSINKKEILRTPKKEEINQMNKRESLRSSIKKGDNKSSNKKSVNKKNVEEIKNKQKIIKGQQSIKRESSIRKEKDIKIIEEIPKLKNKQLKGKGKYKKGISVINLIEEDEKEDSKSLRGKKVTNINLRSAQKKNNITIINKKSNIISRSQSKSLSKEKKKIPFPEIEFLNKRNKRSSKIIQSPLKLRDLEIKNVRTKTPSKNKEILKNKDKNDKTLLGKKRNSMINDRSTKKNLNKYSRRSPKFPMTKRK